LESSSREAEPITSIQPFRSGTIARGCQVTHRRDVRLPESAFVLVYRAVLGKATQIHCVPVFGRTTPERWADTWHGIQQVTEEFVKLQYYRFYVLPFLS
jgi:hypothetical protein